jgi:hypothetical protein
MRKGVLPVKLRDLEIGSVVLEEQSGLQFLVAAQNHPGYGGTTLLCRNIVELGCMDGAEPDTAGQGVFEQRKLYGSNDYGQSNLHRWFNSDTKTWFRQSHDADTPPEEPYLRYGEVSYTGREGFLNRFSPLFRQALLEADIPYLRRTERDSGEMTSVRGSVFIPSRTELGKGNEHGFAEGSIFPLSYDPTVYVTCPTEAVLEHYGRKINPARPSAKYDAPQIYDPKYGWWYWVRTANMGYDFLNRVASPYGALSYTYANNDSVGIRPAVNLDGAAEVVSNEKFIEIFTLCC